MSDPTPATPGRSAPAERDAPNLTVNVVANFLGRGWAGAISLVFVPVYVRFLGVDAYGLIGIYASLLALLSVLDLGLSATLSRELARLSTLPDTEQETRDLLRSMELVYWGVGLAIAVLIAGAAPAIANHWIRSTRLPPSTVRNAILIMGAVAALDWPSALYAGGLTGVQRQVLLNGIRGGSAILQAGGAALVLWLWSPTVTAFFAWQVVIAVVQTTLLARGLWSALPRARRAAAFSVALLRKHWRFAAGMTGIALLSTILMQLDKVILSRFLTLESFGYYMLAFSVANALNMLVQPIYLAVFPRLSQLAAMDDASGAAALYHRTSQLVSVVIAPIAATLAFFSRETLVVWIRNVATADRTYPLLTVLVVGSALNAIMTIPYMLQVAHGWTRLSIAKNLIAVAAAVPLLVAMVDRYDAMGAAIVWVVINASYFVLEVPFMHRRLLKDELRSWYLRDTLLPVATVLVVCTASRHLLPASASGLGAVAQLTATWLSCTAAAAATLGMLSPASVRSYVRQLSWR